MQYAYDLDKMWFHENGYQFITMGF